MKEKVCPECGGKMKAGRIIQASLRSQSGSEDFLRKGCL